MNFPNPGSVSVGYVHTFGGRSWILNADGGWDIKTTDPMAEYTAADVLAKLKTVDGPESGLDADTLDGLNSTDLVDLANATGTLSDARLPDSVALRGVPTAPTPAAGDSSTQLATTAFVQAEIASDAPTKTGTGATGTWGISITGSAASATNATTASGATQLNAVDDRDVLPNTTGIHNVRAVKPFFVAREMIEGGGSGSDYGDFLVLDTYTDASGGSPNALFFDKNEKKILHYQGAWNGASWGASRQLAYTDNPLFTGNLDLTSSPGLARGRLLTTADTFFIQGGSPAGDDTGGVVRITGWAGTTADQIRLDGTSVNVNGNEVWHSGTFNPNNYVTKKSNTAIFNDPESFNTVTATNYKKLGTIYEGSGQLRVLGTLGGHTPAEGRATVDLNISLRGGLRVSGTVIGKVGTGAWLEVRARIDDGDMTSNFTSQFDVFLCRGNYYQSNVQVFATGSTQLDATATWSETVPTGAVAWSLTTHDPGHNGVRFVSDTPGSAVSIFAGDQTVWHTGTFDPTAKLDRVNGIATDTFRLTGLGPATLTIEADSDNVNEDDVATLVIGQDGMATQAKLGLDNTNNFYIQPSAVGVGNEYINRLNRAGAVFKVWDAGNDGAGSGLDADLLDGIDSANVMVNRGPVTAASYLDANYDTFTANGFYQVSGAPIADTRAMLAFNTSGSTGPVQLEFAYTGLARWRNKTDSANWSAWRNFWHSGNFDPALKLDASSYTATDVLSKLLTVDGVSSALDADLLDGQHGAFYQNAGNLTAGTLLAARMPALTGDVTTTAGAVATTIANGAVTLGKMANLAANSFIGNNTGAATTPIAMTVAQAKTLLALTKSDVGLANVDNTSDANKPVSSATQTALNLKANATHKYHTFTTGEYYFDDYSQGNYFRLFSENARSDTARFGALSAVEYWDGAAWVAWVGGDAILKSLFDGREDSTASIDHTHRKFRFVLTKSTGWTTTAILALQSNWSPITYPSTTVTLENQVTGVWTVKDTAVFAAPNTSNGWGTHVKVAAGLHDGQANTRITIDITDWTDVPAQNAYTIPLLRLMILSNYSGARPEPFSWNYEKVMDFKALPTVNSSAFKTALGLVKTDVGLGNVDNTSDLNKPLSTATTNALALKVDSSLIGAANGIVPLGSDSKIAATYLPSYVDDVLEYTNQAGFPATGESGKMYVALDTNKVFRWSGSAYIEISASPGTTDAVTEGTNNLYFTNARAQAAIVGGASTIASANLTANRALISNASGKVMPSSVTDAELGYLSGVTSAIQTQLGNKANSASPTFTGTPTAPTAAAGTNTTQIATTAFVTAAVAAGGGGGGNSMDLTAITDWATVDSTGGKLYFVGGMGSATDDPSNNGLIGLAMNRTAGNRFILGGAYAADELWYRRDNGAGLTPWVRVWDSVNFDPATKLNVGTNGPVFQQSVVVNAVAGTNANYYLRDDAGVNQGILFWDRAADAIRLRRTGAAGTTVEGELSLTATDLQWDGQSVWHSGTFNPTTTVVNYARQALHVPSTGSPSLNDVSVKGLVQYRSDVASPVGAIVLSAPTGALAVMHNLIVRGTNFVNGQTFAMQVAGYKQTATSGWSHTSKVNFGRNDIQVRWGIDAAGKNCLILGDVSTSWSYPHVVVDGYLGYSGMTEAYAKDWSVALVTDLSAFTYVTTTVTDSGIADSPYKSTVNTFSAVNTFTGGLISQKSASGVSVRNSTAANILDLGQGYNNDTDGIGWIYNRPNADLVLGANNAERLRILAAGGATVTGDLVATGDVRANGTYYYGDDKPIVQYSDSWLRLNPTGSFASGIYTGSTGTLRHDGTFQTGGLTTDGLYVTTGGTCNYKGNAIWHAGTFDPASKLGTAGGTITGDLSFGSTTRQMVNLWGTTYGHGVQNNTMYFRTGAPAGGLNGGFAWFRGGAHDANVYNPGTGGTLLAVLDGNGNFRSQGELISLNGNALRMVQGSYGAFWRNDGADAHLLMTAVNDQYGSWNTLRPFSANLATGNVSMGHDLTVGGLATAQRFYAGWDSGVSGSVSCNNWFRSWGQTGIYFNDYGGGWYMTDTTYVRAYNGKQVAAADFVISSDRRLKAGIGKLDYRGRLRPVSFVWRKNGTPDFGFIAQEVEKLYPEAVGEIQGDPLKGEPAMIRQLSYHKLTAVLSFQVNAVEDDVVRLKKKLEVLVDKNHILETEVKTLRRQMAKVLKHLELN